MDFEAMLLENYISRGIITQEKFDKMVADLKEKQPPSLEVQLAERDAIIEKLLERDMQMQDDQNFIIEMLMSM